MKKQTRQDRNEKIYMLFTELGLTYKEIAAVLRAGGDGDLHPEHIGRIVREMKERESHGTK